MSDTMNMFKRVGGRKGIIQGTLTEGEGSVRWPPH